MDTVAEIRELRRDLTDLGDYATADLLDKADRCLSAWDFDAGWRCLERALEERQRRDNLVRPVAGVARYFAACVAALA